MNAFLAIMSSSATSITFSPFQCILWRLRVSSVRLPNAKERNGLRLIAFEIKCLRCGSSGSCAPWIFVDGIAARARSVIRSRDGVGFKSLNSKGRHSSPHVRQISIWTGDGKAISASRTWSLIIHFVPRLLNEDSHARSYPPPIDPQQAKPHFPDLQPLASTSQPSNSSHSDPSCRPGTRRD
jgi:hypothetical protein